MKTKNVRRRNERLPKRLERLGAVQQKIILVLLAGVAIGLSRSGRVFFKVVDELPEALREVDRTQLTRGIGALCRSKLVRRKKHTDGTETLVFTEAGKKRALRFNVQTLRVPVPKQWDGKWRLVTYDIPEGMRDFRIELLGTLKRMGFLELQHSVFIHPFECKDEIEYLIEAYDAREYIRRMVIEEIDSPEPLLKHFKLQHHR